MTKDLAAKVADDVAAVILRTLVIAPPPRLPILLSAVAKVLGMTAAELDLSSGEQNGPTPDSVMLAALLGARSGIDPTDAIKLAHEDFDLLKAAGRVPAAMGPRP